MDPTEYEDLDALIRSAGWARFKAVVVEQWGQHGSGGVVFTQAVMAAQKQADALPKLQQVCFAQVAIQGLISEFESRLQQLKAIEERPYNPARRGML